MNHCQTTTKQMSIVYGISRNQCLLQKKTLQETNESNISINRQAIFLKTKRRRSYVTDSILCEPNQVL